MAQLIFKRGSLANLNNLAITDGQFIVTTDEGALYVDNGSTRVRLGDFIVVENVAALPTEGANRKAMYYCESENVLARWNGTDWTQINKQPTTAELKVKLGLDADGEVTAAIAAAKKAGDDAQVDVDNLATYVGTIPNGEDGQPMASSVVAYINKKTDGIATSGNLEALGNRVTTVEGKVATIEGDYLKAADKTELEGKITEAQTAADNAQAYAEGVASDLGEHEADTVAHITAEERAAWNGKTTMDEVIAKNYATKDEAQGYANAKDDAIEAAQSKADQAYELAGTKATMGEVNEAIAGAGHAVKADVDTAIENLGKAYVAADEALETKLQGNIDKKVDQTAYDTKVGELVAEDERLAGLISDNADAIAAEKERAEGVEADLQGQINLIMNNPDTKDVIDSISEFTTYIEEHGEIAEGFRTDIDQNKTDIAAEVKRAGEAESALSGRIDTLEAIDHEAYIAADETNLQAAKDYADAAVEGLGIGDYAKQSDLDSHTGDTVAHITADERTAWNASEKNAKDYADGLNSTMSARVDALELIDHDHANKAELDLIASGDKAKWDAAEAKAHEHANSAELAKIAEGDVAKWNGAQAAAEATAAAALATARTEISAEIDADVLVETNRAKGVEEGLQSAIDTINNTENGILAQAKSDATSKANAAQAAAEKTASDALTAALTWGEF